jgi:hypothetical protein
MPEALKLNVNDEIIDFEIVYIGAGKWGVNMNGQAAGRVVQGVTLGWVARVALTADGEAGDDLVVPIHGYPDHADAMKAAYAVARGYYDRHMQPVAA